ncbi:MAG: TetR/AcrR family transcriptional regulator [Thermodesulfobacteriota bacterium]
MPKIVNHDQYREQLLKSCYDLFAEKGYSSVTMREIASELSVSTGTLYHYFPSKQAILEQLLIVMGTRDVEEARRRTATSGSFEERLKIFFEFFLDNQANFQKMLLLSVDFLRHADVSGSQDLVSQWLHFYLSNMEKYLELPRAVSQFILVFFNGLVYQVKLFPDSISATQQIALFSEVLLSYLQAHKDPRNRLCRMCPFLTDHKEPQAKAG